MKTSAITTTQQQKFDYILSNKLEKEQSFLLNKEEKVLFDEYYWKFHGYESVQAIYINRKADTKVSKKVKSNFYCGLSKTKDKSTLNIISKVFGIKGVVLKFSLEMNKKVMYNNHSYCLVFKYNKLRLVVDEKLTFDWNMNELVKRSKLNQTDIIKSIKENKIKVSFNKSEIKDHGTKVVIYN